MVNTFFIRVHNREYSDYEFFMYTENGESEKITLEIDPIDSALFHGDGYKDSETAAIQKSPTREPNIFQAYLFYKITKPMDVQQTKKDCYTNAFHITRIYLHFWYLRILH